MLLLSEVQEQLLFKFIHSTTPYTIYKENALTWYILNKWLVLIKICSQPVFHNQHNDIIPSVELLHKDSKAAFKGLSM